MSESAPDPLAPAQSVLDDVRKLTDGVALLYRLREHRLDDDDDMQWVLPRDFAPDLAKLHGLRVVYADVPHPMLAHRVGRWSP